MTLSRLALATLIALPLPAAAEDKSHCDMLVGTSRGLMTAKLHCVDVSDVVQHIENDYIGAGGSADDAAMKLFRERLTDAGHDGVCTGPLEDPEEPISFADEVQAACAA